MNHHEGLPSYCYAVHPSDGYVVRLDRGVRGYILVLPRDSDKRPPAELADDLNAILGVSKAQREAMIAGSMFGWDVPGANPAIYEGKV
jgi:hypothetical protein